ADHITSLQDCGEVLVRNYARRGSTAWEDITPQVSRFLVDHPANSSSSLDATESLYIIYLVSTTVGAQTEDELESIMETLFDAIHVLHTTAVCEILATRIKSRKHLYSLLKIHRILKTKIDCVQKELDSENQAFRTRGGQVLERLIDLYVFLDHLSSLQNEIEGIPAAL
ncbi:hypothetical protein WG66_000531, partial [Moniliophthora roreri]